MKGNLKVAFFGCAMKFEIKRCENGCYLKYENPEDDSENIYLYQNNHRKDEEIECFADFLRLIEDSFAPPTSKYDDKRIYIQTKPGYSSMAYEKEMKEKVKHLSVLLSKYIKNTEELKEVAELILYEIF